MSFLKDLRVFQVTFRNPNIIFLYTVISFPPENYLELQGEDNLSVLGELSLFSFLFFKSFAMRPTIQLKKIYRNFTFSNWTCKSFRSINRRVARSLTFSQVQKLPLYSPFADMALKQIWANVPRTRWPSLHKRTTLFTTQESKSQLL